MARIQAPSKIWMWSYKINSQCTQEEENMLRFGAGNMDGFNMIGLLLPGVAVTYNGEEIGIFLAPGIVIGTSLMIHQCNKCNMLLCACFTAHPFTRNDKHCGFLGGHRGPSRQELWTGPFSGSRMFKVAKYDMSKQIQQNVNFSSENFVFFFNSKQWSF